MQLTAHKFDQNNTKKGRFPHAFSSNNVCIYDVINLIKSPEGTTC